MADELLLAAGPGEILPVIFVVIAIISGIVNHIKEKNAAAARMANRGGRNPREANLQGEIESFLNEVSASDRSAGENRRRQRPPNRAGQSQQQQRRRKKASRARQEQPAERPPRQNRRESVASRHLDSGDIGHMRERHVESAVEQRHLESSVAETHAEVIFEDESSSAPAGIVGGKQSVSAAGIQLFQQAGGIRSVIVMNEILSKPLSRRRGDR